MTLEVRALDESTWPAFASLVEANGGIFGGCWCVGMHPDGFDPRGAAGNKERKHATVRAGTTHAALVFDGDECVGWAQFGAPTEVARIKNRPAAEKDRPLPDWRIGCCYSGKGHRKQGVSATAIAGAVDLIRDLGGGTIEGYPEDAADVSAGFLYHGALASYEKLGFEKVVKVGKHRWVVSKRVRARRTA
ncbi:MAG: GNAT family N-acetyltransferase [Nocardioides sp.]